MGEAAKMLPPHFNPFLYNEGFFKCHHELAIGVGETSKKLGLLFMPLEFSIVEAHLRDLFKLYKLEKECFELDAWPLLDLLAVLVMPGIIRLKAQVDGLMAGFIAGEIRPKGHPGWIATIGVLKPYRRSGIGLALLQACESRMTTERVRLSVRKSNTAAIQMYEKFGYSLVDSWVQYYIDKEDALIFEKRLDFP